MSLNVFAVSDSTGETAQRVIRAALVQFEDVPVTVHLRGKVRTPKQVRTVVREAVGQDSLILHTLVSDDLRRVMLSESRAHGVDAMDLMGPLLDRLTHHLQVSPQEKPGLFQQLSEARTRQIEAVDFAFRHDDGQRTEELEKAEVVLVGVSRTMKTPTALYLAYQGWFAANVPIIPGIPLPEALLKIPSSRTFCMAMSPRRLMELRQVRANYLSITDHAYAELENIREELRECQQLCGKHEWQHIDVTGKSVEETAQEIVLLLRAATAKD
jgi:regulator of PEP synthase PpsR (kinase-PPPase family)